MTDEIVLDPRLRSFGSAECFICGRRILVRADYCNVESPVAQNVKLAAHTDCVNGMGGMDLVARYQTAAFAALSGEGKEEIPWAPPTAI